MAKPKARKVKVVRIGYGIFGRTNTRKVEKTIQKFMGKGFVLDKQDDHAPRGCFSSGYTLLTFIEREG